MRSWWIAGILPLLFASALVAADAPKPLRLVVAVSVDQVPQEYLTRMRHGFAEDGFFRRVERQGAQFVQCNHGHALTKTGPGHSVMMTGAFPSTTGIIDNDWFDRAAGKTVYCVEDADSAIVGAPESNSAGVSPRNLRVGTLGDVLKLATGGRAKVFGVALKDRGGVLMAGHAADACYWFDSGRWVTSRYYRDDLPGYIRNYNESGQAGRFAGQPWELLLPADQYVQIVPDDNPHETLVAGLGRTFPKRLPESADSTYFKAMPVSPYGNEMTLDIARMLIEFEQLGQDDVPDLLCISFSSNDYVGHAFGPQSLEVQDMTFRTDRQLGQLLDWLDKAVGPDQWLLALTSDHGVAPIPEIAQQLGLPAQRAPLGDLKQLANQLEAVLVAQWGTPADGKKYLQRVDADVIYLDRDLPELAGMRYAQAQRLVRDALVRHPGVAVAFSRDDLLAAPATAMGRRFQRTFNPQLSGDVLYALPPYCLPSGKTGTTHGSPWQYDTHVPLLFIGHGVKPGRHADPVTPAHMGPTLTLPLGIDLPSGTEVAPLSKVYRSTRP